jgi:hypothetical protein
MALGIINITTTLVGTTLADATREVFNLCTSANINKWSRYKPVTGVRPAGTSGKYGLNLPTNWDIVPIVNAARMGDFRGYEHDKDLAGPVVYLRTPTDLPTYATLKPSDAPTTAVWTFRMNTVHEDVRIVPSDLGLQNYYFGIKLQPASGGTYYKTQTNVLATGQTLGINVALDDPSLPSFIDCPYAIGTFTWSAFISSTSASAWTASAPSNIIYLPTGTYGSITIVNTGTFVVTNWIQVSDNSHSWLDHESTYANYKESIIYTNLAVTQWYITDSVGHPFPAWLSYKVYDEGGTLDITGTPAFWTDKCCLRLFPTVAQDPGDSALSGDVFINDGTDDLISIIVAQDAAPPRYTVNFGTWAGDTSGLTLSATSGYIDDGEQILHITFTPSISGVIYYRIHFRGAEVGTGSISGCTAGVSKVTTVNATQVMTSGDTPPSIELSGDIII